MVHYGLQSLHQARKSTLQPWIQIWSRHIMDFFFFACVWYCWGYVDAWYFLYTLISTSCFKNYHFPPHYNGHKMCILEVTWRMHAEIQQGWILTILGPLGYWNFFHTLLQSPGIAWNVRDSRGLRYFVNVAPVFHLSCTDFPLFTMMAVVLFLAEFIVQWISWVFCRTFI